MSAFHVRCTAAKSIPETLPGCTFYDYYDATERELPWKARLREIPTERMPFFEFLYSELTKPHCYENQLIDFVITTEATSLYIAYEFVDAWGEQESDTVYDQAGESLAYVDSNHSGADWLESNYHCTDLTPRATGVTFVSLNGAEPFVGELFKPGKSDEPGYWASHNLRYPDYEMRYQEKLRTLTITEFLTSGED
jgi:hypothetical protein